MKVLGFALLFALTIGACAGTGFLVETLAKLPAGIIGIAFLVILAVLAKLALK